MHVGELEQTFWRVGCRRIEEVVIRHWCCRCFRGGLCTRALFVLAECCTGRLATAGVVVRHLNHARTFSMSIAATGSLAKVRLQTGWQEQEACHGGISTGREGAGRERAHALQRPRQPRPSARQKSFRRGCAAPTTGHAAGR